MDGDFRTDIDGILEQVATAEIVSFYFPLLRKSLLVDMRFTAEDDPLVLVAPAVSSPEERLRKLRRLRPQFPRPEDIALVMWPHHAAALQRSGVLDGVRERLEEARRAAPLAALENALRHLANLEREELVKAITGDQYHTLWPAKR